MCDSGVTLVGETKCLSLLGVKQLSHVWLVDCTLTRSDTHCI